MSRMEDYNYFHDPRVKASMINHGKVVEEGRTKYLVVESGEEDEPDIKLLCKWGVCGLCNGDGTHTNPSIDAGGIGGDDEFWDDDCDEEGNSRYFSGAYDVTCTECKGKRVVPEVDRERNDAAMIERYDDHMKSEYDYADESAAERAMGA